MTIYGANLNNRLPGLARGKGFVDTTKSSDITEWWCATCQLLVKQNADPIDCDDCGGEMTIAPLSVRGKVKSDAN